jgi:hypothetical protein
MNEDYERQIVKEQLEVNGELEFKRQNKSVEFGDFNKIEDLLNDKTDSNINKQENPNLNNLLHISLSNDELFLTNGFKIFVSQSLVKIILEWFESKFMVIYRSNSLQLIRRFSDPKKGTVYVDKTINEAAKLFGVGANSLGYRVSEDNSDAKLVSIFSENNAAVSSEVYESYGTVRFVNIFPLVMRAICTGGTLVVDEFDASIHPMAIMNIINIFHNDDINKKHAQLIFNTHNPIFLNANLLRRDEIKFVERDDDKHTSVVYALSDFGTKGDDGVRKGSDYMSHYFINKYGAIRDVDFAPIFEHINSVLDDNKGE